MRKRLDRLALQVFNRPLLINGDKLDVILSAVGNRILTGTDLSMPAEMLSDDSDDADGIKLDAGGYLLEESGIGVFQVMGTLVRRGSWLDSASGLCSYGAIADGIETMMADSRVKGVLIEIDSPGGEASGCFDLVRALRAMSEKSDKPIWAIANDMACSGGFAIACAAEKIWITELGEAGSIGVVATHVDISQADKKAGVKWTYITAGKHKVDGNCHEPLSPEVKGSFQEDINTIYGMFVDVVAESRRLSPAAVMATEAAIFMGQKAVDAGLVDAVGTIDSAVSAFGDFLNGKATASMSPALPAKTRRTTMKQTKKVSAPAAKQDDEATLLPAAMPKAEADEPDIQGEDPAPTEPVELGDEGEEEVAVAAPRAKETVSSVKLAEGRAIEIVRLGTQAQKFGIRLDVAKAIASGVSVDALRKQIMDSAADADDASAITAIDPSATAKEAADKGSHKAGWERSIAKLNKRYGIASAT